jgi:V/A-type H+-transporting ATPase subunit B
MGEVAAHIATQATVPGKEGSFLVVFAGIGISAREADAFLETFGGSDVLEGGVFLLNKADDPVGERLLTPRAALTIAEYFAFVKGYDVLVVMTDMFNYCEALREVGTARREASGRRGYPLSMSLDLAELYERAGCLARRPGSLTQISVAVLPGDDISHPVADLSRTLTDAQVVLDRRLHASGIFPPLDVSVSLSRMINQDRGRDWTFDSRQALAVQLCHAYGKARELPRSHVAGEESFSDAQKRYLSFGDAFEKFFVAQGKGRTFERRTFAQSEAKGWEVLRELSAENLDRLPRTLLERKFSA